uniref:Putative membrane glycoprotein lig-1 n=1 Tax=Anopheles triannulatus TaxID=58253 RepID=A0A2M4A6L8_9DIPT
MAKRLTVCLALVGLLLPAVLAKEFRCTMELDRSCSVIGAKLAANELNDATIISPNPSTLNKLQFTGSNLASLPPSLFTNFPKLEIVNASGADLKQFPSNTLATAKALQELHLRGNRIHNLPQDAFFGANRLTTLDLSNNEINSIDGSAFRRLRDLKILLLAGNQIVQLPEDVFRDLTELEELELQGNRLSSLGNTMLAGCTSLRKLNLSRNALKAIELEQFERRWSFDVIDLSGNALQTVMIPSNLRELVATGNGIRSVQLNGVSSELILLKMPHNKLESLDRLPTLEKLISLDLAYNQIRQFDLQSVARFGKLVLLKLNGNQLETVANGLPGPVTHLKYLHLADNRLKQLDLNAAFGKVPRLITLDLSGNQLERVSVNDLSGSFSVLVRLKLQGNALQCEANRPFLKELKQSVTAYALTPNDCRKGQQLIDGLCCQ